MTLHNYIRKHATCDCQFEKMKVKMISQDKDLDAKGEEDVVEGGEEEEYYISIGPTSQIINSIRDDMLQA